MLVIHRDEKRNKQVSDTYFCVDTIYKVVLRFSTITEMPIGFLKLRKTTAIQLLDINHALVQEVFIRRNKNIDRELGNMVSDYAEDYVFKNFLKKPLHVEIQTPA